MSGDVGRCGSETPRLLGGPPLFCTLRAGHDGWHEDGITSWSPRAPIAAARPAAGDTRTDRERVREVIARAILEAQPWCESWDVLSDGPGTLREEFRGYADAVLDALDGTDG